MRLSLCMIVRNEKALLERCLRSIKDLVDEIVIVDTGSTDGSQDMARGLGAKVFATSWEQNFSKPRNKSLEEAHGRWILVLDADEQLLDRDRAALGDLLARHTPDQGSPKVAFNLLQKSSFDEGRTSMLVPIVRLFPNRPEIRFEWPIHEQVATSLIQEGIPILDTKIEILHDGYADPARNIEKNKRNLKILQDQIDTARDVYPLTHFFLADSKLEGGDSEGALKSYQSCVRIAPPEDAIAKGAKIRIATCLTNLRRHAEALATMPAASSTDWHPELLVSKGQCEKALGRRQAACDAFTQVLSITDAAFNPPCNLGSVKLDAMLKLSSLLKEEGKDALAVKLLRSIVACHKAGQVLDKTWLDSVLN